MQIMLCIHATMIGSMMFSYICSAACPYLSRFMLMLMYLKLKHPALIVQPAGIVPRTPNKMPLIITTFRLRHQNGSSIFTSFAPISARRVPATRSSCSPFTPSEVSSATKTPSPEKASHSARPPNCSMTS